MRTIVVACALLIAVPTFGWAQTAKEHYERILQIEIDGQNKFNLGWNTHNDRFLKDSAEAVSNQMDEEALLAAMAKRGNVDARYYMGMLYYHRGLEDEVAESKGGGSRWQLTAKQDFDIAITWLKPLAVEGYPGAQWSYGNAFAEGRGVAQSPSNAIEWWYKAANTFQKNRDREDALTLFDMMRKFDPANSYTIKLRRSLFPGDK